MFVGSWLSGFVVDYYAHTVAGGAVVHNWRAIWLFSAISSAVVLVLFLFNFRDKEPVESANLQAERMVPDIPL